MYTSVCTCVCTLKCVHTCVCVCVCVWRCRRKTRNIFRKKGRYDVVSSSQLMTDEKSSYFRQIHLWQILPTVDPYKLQAIPSETQTHKPATTSTESGFSTILPYFLGTQGNQAS